MRRLVASRVKRAVEINCDAEACPCCARAATIACFAVSASRFDAEVAGAGAGVAGAGSSSGTGVASLSITGSGAGSGFGGALGKGITSPAGSAWVRWVASAADPLTAWLSTTGADCINGPDPKGERDGGGALDGPVEDGREPVLEEVLLGGAAGVLGGAGGADPPLLTGEPLATPLSSSSSGSNLCA